MTGISGDRPDDSATQELRFSFAHFVAATLAAVVAGIHLWLGVWNWTRYAAVGLYVPPDVRWPLFVLAGGGIAVGMLAVARGSRPVPLYVAGMVLQVVLVIGYFGWHIGGHRRMLLFGRPTPHQGPLLDALVVHIVSASTAATVALVAETALFVVLGYLIVLERR